MRVSFEESGDFLLYCDFAEGVFHSWASMMSAISFKESPVLSFKPSSEDCLLTRCGNPFSFNVWIHDSLLSRQNIENNLPEDNPETDCEKDWMVPIPPRHADNWPVTPRLWLLSESHTSPRRS